MKRKTEAEQHGFKVGDRVIVLTIKDPKSILVGERHLFRYDTAADFAADWWRRDGFEVTVSYAQWDGVERVDFDNGD